MSQAKTIRLAIVGAATFATQHLATADSVQSSSAQQVAHHTPAAKQANKNLIAPPPDAPNANASIPVANEELAKIGARDLTHSRVFAIASDDAPTQAAIQTAIRDFYEVKQNNKLKLQADAQQQKASVEADKKSVSTAEFVKRYHIVNSDEPIKALEADGFNPHLIAQLEPLARKIARSDVSGIRILYADYVSNGQSRAENSKILLVDGLKGEKRIWTYYAHEHNKQRHYYDYEGNAPELAMDRLPLKFTRISSPFSYHRRHPVTGRVQAHTGTDFAAPVGTPVHAAGNGVVSFAGWQKGYGRIVMIEHDNGYQTRYAHLSSMEVSRGQQIKRGQLLGKVGTSGVSTGPHLHYEVRIAGVAHDPMTVHLPSHQPLNKEELGNWRYRAEQYRLALNALQEQDSIDGVESAVIKR